MAGNATDAARQLNADKEVSQKNCQLHYKNPSLCIQIRIVLVITPHQKLFILQQQLLKKKKPHVVNMQRSSGCGVLIPMCTPITQFMNPWLRKHCVGSWGEGNEAKIEIAWELGCLL